VETYRWTRAAEENLRSKGQRLRSPERTCENRFLLLSSSKVDRFTSNQYRSDHGPILHISSYTFYQRKYFVFLWYLSLIYFSGRTACRSGHLPVHVLVIIVVFLCLLFFSANKNLCTKTILYRAWCLKNRKNAGFIFILHRAVHKTSGVGRKRSDSVVGRFRHCRLTLMSEWDWPRSASTFAL